MRIQPYLKKDGTGSIKLYPHKTPGGNVDMFHSIDIFVDFQKWDHPELGLKVEVNWSGCGSQDSKLAAAYGYGLVTAAALAENIAEVGIEKALLGYRCITQAEADAYWAETSVSRTKV